MSKYVLDASALLALFNKEKGWEKVLDILPHSIMSAVNLSECAAILFMLNIPRAEVVSLLNSFIPEIVAFDDHQAILAGELRTITKEKGLSLGDRACLALSKEKKLTALTADKAWMDINSDIRIECIR